MKKIVLLIIIACFTMAGARAQADNQLVVHAGKLNKIEIGDHMNVVLVQDQSDSVTKAVGKAAEQLNVSFSFGTLHLSSRYLLKNTVVYLVVKDVKAITLGEGSKLISEGGLKVKGLELFLYDDSHARLHTNAPVKAHSLGKYEVNVIRTPFTATVGNVL